MPPLLDAPLASPRPVARRRPGGTAAGQLARALARRGVRHAFGIPGGDVLPLVEALHGEGVPFVLTRHEASAAFAAGAASVLTGRPGLCVATLGPGAMNLLAGLAGAWLDRQRVVAVTGRLPRGIRSACTHMELDHGRLFAGLTRRTVELDGTAATLARALAPLDAGRPGRGWRRCRPARRCGG